MALDPDQIPAENEHGGFGIAFKENEDVKTQKLVEYFLKEKSEPIGLGAPTKGGTREENTATQNLTIRLLADRIDGKAGALESGRKIPEIKQEEFDPDTHTENLRRRVAQLFEHQKIIGFISNLHPDDIAPLQGMVLSRLMMSTWEGPARMFAAVLRGKESLAQGHEKHTSEQLRALFIDFWHEFEREVLDQLFDWRSTLHMNEFDSEIAVQRCVTSIGTQRQKMGPGQPQNFVDYLLNRSLAAARKEIEEKKKQATDQQLHKDQIPEGGTAQSWLDQKKERAFTVVSGMFQEIYVRDGDEGIRQWFMDFFNPAFEECGRGALRQEDIKSLVYLTVESESASRIVGTPIRRPVLLFTHIGEFQRFSAKLQGVDHGMASRGLFMPPELFHEEDPLRQTGLIIATANKEFIGHEVRHSIDSNLDTRKGYDRIIEELIAHYQDEIVAERSLATYAHLPDPSEGPWRSLAHSIGGKMYWEKYSEEAREKISHQQFAQLCTDVVAATRSMQQKIGHVETVRALIQMKTLNELFHFQT